MYWGDVTSSVDFCEPNYVLSDLIAEPANSISSLVFVAQGLVGIFIANPSRGDGPHHVWANRMFFVMYLTLTMVGVGSTLLHATLTAWGQAADEVPMLLLSIAILSTLLELESTTSLRRPYLPVAVAAVSAGVVTIYFWFQEIYAAFLAVYASSVVLIVLWTGQLALKKRDSEKGEQHRREVILPLWAAAMGSYVGCGAVAWVTDFVLCTPILSRFGNFGSMILHPLWHLGAGWGTWLAIQVLAAARAEAIGASGIELRWYAGILPFVLWNKNHANRRAD